MYHFTNTPVDQSYKYIFLEFLCGIWIYQPPNTDHTMIYARRGHSFTSEKVRTNMLHLGLECLFFHLHIHVKYITDVLFS